MARAGNLLAGSYHLVITNVPYLARGKQSQSIRDYCQSRYPASKNDLATVFLERCLELCAAGGTASLVLPQNWLFLASYRKLREKLLKAELWNLLARLGEGAFESSAAAGAFVTLLIMGRNNGVDRTPGQKSEQDYVSTMHGLNASESRTVHDKAARLRDGAVKQIEQARQLKNPDARIAFSEISGELLEKYVAGHQGIATGDYPCFGRKFWEFPQLPAAWRFQQSTVLNTVDFGGREHILHWGREGEIYLKRRQGVRIQGGRIWNRTGVVASQMRALPVTRYTGELFDNNSSGIGPAATTTLPRSGASAPLPNTTRRCAVLIRSSMSPTHPSQSSLRSRPLESGRGRTIPQWPSAAILQRPNAMDFSRPSLRLGGLGRE